MWGVVDTDERPGPESVVSEGQVARESVDVDAEADGAEGGDGIGSTLPGQ